jgi:hypothetical protein
MILILQIILASSVAEVVGSAAAPGSDGAAVLAGDRKPKPAAKEKINPGLKTTG